MSQLEGIHIQKVHKQHTTLVVTVPIAVRKALDITAGSHVIFASHPGTKVVEFSKFELKGTRHDRGKGSSDRKDRDG